jgi:proline iminopeptidase
MIIVAAEDDIRPSWPLRQLAALVRRGVFAEVPGVPHDLWSTHPQVWVDVVTKACRNHS